MSVKQELLNVADLMDKGLRVEARLALAKLLDENSAFSLSLLEATREQSFDVCLSFSVEGCHGPITTRQFADELEEPLREALKSLCDGLVRGDLQYAVKGIKATVSHGREVVLSLEGGDRDSAKEGRGDG